MSRFWRRFSTGFLLVSLFTAIASFGLRTPVVSAASPSADLAVTSVAASPDPVNAAQNITYTINVSNNGSSTFGGGSSAPLWTFSSPSGMLRVPADGEGPGFASPYPWAINVSGVSGTVEKVVVTITDLYYNDTVYDLDMMLVGPNNQRVMLMSDAGDRNVIDNVNLVFDDAAGSFLPSGAEISSGTFRPSNYDGDDGDIPGLSATSGLLSAFNGSDPNGQWRLYAFDDAANDWGDISAWGLRIYSSASVTVNHVLPVGTTYVSASGTGWTCAYTAATRTVSCTRTTMATGAAPAITVVATAPNNGGDITASTTISSTIPDPTSSNNSASTTITVDPVSNLSLTMTDSPDPVDTGGTLTYVLKVANAGPSVAPAAQVVHTLPAGVTFVSATSSGWTCSGTGPVTCNATNLAVGAAADITVVVTAPTTAGTLNSSASVSSAADSNTANNGATAATTVRAIANLSVSLSDNPDPVVASSALAYTAAVVNAGTAKATNLQLIITLPAGVSVASIAGGSWQCADASGTITCTLAELAAGPTASSVTVNVTAPSNGGSISASATVSATEPDPSSANNTATATTTVQGRSDLSIVKTGPDGTVLANQPVSYVLRVANAGPSTSAVVTVVDTMPAGMSNINASGDGWSCVVGGSTVSCTRANLGIGSAPDITITATAPLDGSTLTNSATVSGSNTDPNAANNTSSVETSVVASSDLSISVDDTPDPVYAGQLLTYRIIVQNDGPSTARNLKVTNTLPPQVTFDSAGGTNWRCTGTSVVTCAYQVPLAEGVAPEIIITVRAPIVDERLTVNNNAIVTSDAVDPNDLNDSYGSYTFVDPTADLEVELYDSKDPVDAAEAYSYLVRVFNDGVSKAKDVQVLISLPPGVTYTGITPNTWFCVGTGPITCSAATLPLGQAPDITVAVTAPPDGGTITASATISTPTHDLDSSDNTVNQSTLVLSRSDLVINKTGPAAAVDAGSLFTYYLSVTNNGPSTPTSFTMVDTLPAEVTFVDANVGATGWSCAYAAVTHTVTCTRTSIPVGTTSAEVPITVRAPAEGTTLRNTASVSSPITDHKFDNNSIKVDTVVRPVADVGVSITRTADPIYTGQTIVYTLNLANAGPSTAISNTLVVTLPVSGTLLGVSSPGWSCPAPSGGTLTCTRVSWPVSAGAITISWQAPAPGPDGATLTLSAVISSAILDRNLANNSDSETVTVIAAAALSVLKSDSVDPLYANTPFSYTLKVANGGASVASSVRLTDTLPTGLTLLGISTTGWSCNYTVATRQIVCTLGSLPIGSAPDIIVDVRAPAEGDLLTNNVVVSARQVDLNPSNNADSETTVVIGTADLSIAKSDSVDPIDAGEVMSYTLQVANAGPSTGVLVVVTDTLPLGVTYMGVAAKPNVWSCGYDPGGHRVICTAQRLGLGAAPAIVVNVVAASEPGLYTNAATVSAAGDDRDLSNNADSEVTRVLAVSNLGIFKADTPDPVGAASVLTYRLQVTNHGPSSIMDRERVFQSSAGISIPSSGMAAPYPSTLSVSGVSGRVKAVRVNINKLTHGAPDDLDLMLVGPRGQSVILMSDAGGSTPAAGVTLTFDAVSAPIPDDAALASGSYKTANYAPADLFFPDAPAAASHADLSAFAGLDPNGDWRLYIVDDEVVDGGSIESWSVSIITDEDIVVEDTLPAGLTFGGVSGDGWTCSYDTGTRLVRCLRTSLPVGPAPEILISLVTPAEPTTLSNTATVRAFTFDPDGANNSSTQVTTVLPKADLALTMVYQPNPDSYGTSMQYVLSASNNGTSVAPAVVVTDTLPAALTFMSATGSGWSCSYNAGPHTVVCTRPSMPVGPAPDITIVVGVPQAGGALDNVAIIRSGAIDPDLANNTAEVTGPLAPRNWVYLPLVDGLPARPDLVASFTLTPSRLTFDSDDMVLVTITITNQGTAQAGEFWVDLFINPRTPPTAPDHPWDQCSLSRCKNIAWRIVGGLAAGQSITLSSESRAKAYSNWDGRFEAGTTDLYLYADSWSGGKPTGMVDELVETNNRAELHGLVVTVAPQGGAVAGSEDPALPPPTLADRSFTLRRPPATEPE